MDDALGLARGAGGVHEEQRVACLHDLGGGLVALLPDQILVHEVPAVHHVHADIAAADHDHGLHAVGAGPDQGGVRGLLEVDDLAVAIKAVGGDEQLGLGVVDALPERLGREPGEDHRVDGPDLGRGEHGDDGLGQLRHVDDHAVALAHAQRTQGVGEPVHLAVEFEIGVLALVAGLAFPDQGQLVLVGGLDVAVKGVVDHVAARAGEPAVKGRVLVVQDLVPLLEPVQLVGGLFPVPGGVHGRVPARPLQLLGVDVGLDNQLRERAEDPFLLQQIVQSA